MPLEYFWQGVPVEKMRIEDINRFLEMGEKIAALVDPRCGSHEVPIILTRLRLEIYIRQNNLRDGL